ncbi:MAG: helix-turn-helix domain-containing protein [Magnetospirillum gryphiswaldense]|nr:helix-turn-helix domain-containing protein [Magnetospirillum gryphiswaldense]
MAPLVPKASLLPGMVPDEQHLHLWQQSIAPMLEARPVDPQAAQACLPVMHQYHLGRYLFIDCSFTGQYFSRDAAMMARHDDADHLTLQMYVRGANKVSNGGYCFEQKPGIVYGVNLSQEVRAQSQDSEVLVLVLPRQLVLDEVPILADLRGAAFAPDSVCGDLFRDHMLSLRRLLPHAGVETIPALTDSLLGLLDALMAKGDASASAAQGAMFTAVCRFIDQHLDDPELSPDSICIRFRCSRATLYRLFKPQGGVREHIQRRRLMACFKSITTPKHLHRRIFDIALDYGFVSPSHFSHLFRHHFGMTPSEARDMRRGGSCQLSDLSMPSGCSAAEDAERMWHWSKSLTASAALRTAE